MMPDDRMPRTAATLADMTPRYSYAAPFLVFAVLLTAMGWMLSF